MQENSNQLLAERTEREWFSHYILFFKPYNFRANLMQDWFNDL